MTKRDKCICGNNKLVTSEKCNKCIGTVKLDKSGYKYIKIDNNKWTTEHIYLVERYIGYHPKKGWIIHHIDGNPMNNNFDNLYIFELRIHHSNFESLVRAGLIDRFYLKSNLNKYKIGG